MAGGSAPARGSTRTEDLRQLVRLRRALLLLHAPLGIEIEDRRAPRPIDSISSMLPASCLRTAAGISPAASGCWPCRLLGSCRAFCGSLLASSAADLASLSSRMMPTMICRNCTLPASTQGRACSPEHGAVRAVRVAEQVDHARRRHGHRRSRRSAPSSATFPGQRRIHQALQRFAAEVLALGVEQVAGEYVLAVGR